MLVMNLFLVFILILISSFFVAAEFAFIRVRSSKIDQLVIEGNKKAVSVQKILANIDGYLSASQLGITIVSLMLGWIGEGTIENLLKPLLQHVGIPEKLIYGVSFVLSLVIITFVQVIIGELTPKSIAIQKAESLCLMLSGPMILFYRLLYPFIWTLNVSSGFIIKMIGFKPTSEHEEAHSEEELRIILSESYQNGEINQSEYKYVNRIFNFDELLAREIMVPRVDMIAIDVNDDMETIIKTIKEEQYTRFPVVNHDKDEVMGMLHAKEFFIKYVGNSDIDIHEIIRPVITVQETIPVKVLLKQMQTTRAPFAILKDEYGGTSGLVTIEDILEEIVGEIRDEFDSEEKPEIEMLEKNKIVVSNNVLVSQVEEMLAFHLNNEDFDTIGGWLYAQNSELNTNDEYAYENIMFKVMEKNKNRYERILIINLDETVQ